MADETSPDPTPDSDGAATPNRDRRHAPPIIEGEGAQSGDRIETPRSEDRAEIPAPNNGPETGPRQDVAPIAEAPPPASARPILSAAVGALVGAIVAGGGLWFLESRRAPDPDLVSRLEALERNPKPAAPTEAFTALDKRIGALETKLAGAPTRAALDAYGQRLAALESAALSAKAAADANKEALATAQAAHDDAAKALATASAASAAVQRAIEAAGAPAKQDSGADVAALEGRLGKLEQNLAGLARLPAELAPLDQRIGKLEAALAAPKTENRVPAEAAPPSRDGAGLAVVAEALRDRLRAGAPFPIEAAALERLGPDPAKLAILKPLAEKGAPSPGALAADFAKAEPAVLAAATPAASGGVIDRLLANMGKVVRVTPVGELAGDDPAALVSQIKGALARGAAAPALAAWKRLPDPAREASRPWADEADAALAADKAAQGVLDDALARLAANN
jgi:hypothetical protein